MRTGTTEKAVTALKIVDGEKWEKYLISPFLSPSSLLPVLPTGAPSQLAGSLVHRSYKHKTSTEESRERVRDGSESNLENDQPIFQSLALLFHQ